MGFKRSVKRMQQIEARLREGMARNGITGAAADADRAVDHVVRAVRISRIARGELRAASSTPARISRRIIPAAFYTALLNNQPMGFYHPATLVKDAQRHGVRFAPIDVQVSDWDCGDASRRRRCGWGCCTCTGCARRPGRRIARRAREGTACSIARRSGDARRAAAGRTAHAGGSRRARAVRRRSPDGAVAGGAGRPPGRAAARGRGRWELR